MASLRLLEHGVLYLFSIPVGRIPVHRLPDEPEEAGGSYEWDDEPEDAGGSYEREGCANDGAEEGAEIVLRLSTPRMLDWRASDELSEPPNAPPPDMPPPVCSRIAGA